MEEIAPGSILQRMYFRRRMRKLKPGVFIEVGSGNGHLSKILLEMGWKGTGYDLGKRACENNSELNGKYISSGHYRVEEGNFLNAAILTKADLIVSMMVIEHLTEQEVNEYFIKCMYLMKKGSALVSFVPAGMQFWGIEDDVTGHFRRYTFGDFKKYALHYGLKIRDLTGLTFPVSNILLGISNYLVRKSEARKNFLSAKEQTIESGDRNVLMKTAFPPYFKIFLNEVVLFPLYIIQRLFRNSKMSMVIYCEMELH